MDKLELFLQYKPSIIAKSKLKGYDNEFIEDMLQEFYVSKWMKADLSKVKNMKNFILTSFFRRTYDFLRTKDRIIYASAGFLDSFQAEDTELESKIEHHDRLLILDGHIKNIVPLSHRRFAYKVIESGSIRKSAAQVGISIHMAQYIMSFKIYPIIRSYYV